MYGLENQRPKIRVSKIANLTIVKIKANIASFLDALEKVVHRLELDSNKHGIIFYNLG